MVGGSALGRKNAPHGLGVVRPRGQAINRFRRHADQTTGSQALCRGFDGASRTRLQAQWHG
jgi:hypothetical protein